MDVPTVIERIRTLLPDGLTPAQADALDEKLADRPTLCEALSADLSRPDAPPLETFDDILERIEALGAAAATRGPRILPFAAVGVLALAAAIVLLVRPWDRPALVPDNGAATRPASRPAATTRTATAPASRPGDGHGSGGEDPANVTTTRPVVPPLPRTPARMTWQEFALPGSDADADWTARVDTLFKTREGKGVSLDRSRRYLTVEGTCEVTTVPAPGRMLRLGPYDAQQCEVEFWRGRDGVRLELDTRSGVIRAHRVTRENPGATAAVVRSFDDQRGWRWYGIGAIDLRYQDGHLMVCRGEIPLIRIPLAEAPTEGRMTAKRARFWLAEGRHCRPLLLPAAPADTADDPAVTRTMADTLTWVKEGGEKLVLWSEGDGVMALSTAEQREQGKAWCTLDAAPLGGVEATFHVLGAAPSAGLVVRARGTAVPLRVTLHKGKRVVGWGDRRVMDEDVRYGRTVGREFWVRIRRGIDAIRVWISADGKTWWPRTPWPIVKRSPSLEIGLYITADKEPRRVAVGELRIRRFSAIRRMAGVRAGLPEKAAGALTREILSATTREAALAGMAEARPDGVEAEMWARACTMALADYSPHSSVRQDALQRLFVASCRQGADTDVEAILRALAELRDLGCGYTSRVTGEALTELARHCLDHTMGDKLLAVMDAVYLRPDSTSATPSSIYYSAMPAVLRIVLLDLMDRGRWQETHRQAMRAIFMTYGRTHRTVLPLAQWAAAEARSRLGQEADPEAPTPAGAWSGPLVVDDNPATMNVLGEFLFLVKGKQYTTAAKALTRRSLPDALVTLEGRPDLLQSSHFMVRRILRTTPQLRDILKAEHLDIGRIRLERARKQNDLETLKSLAVQFDGTEPGLGAMGVLADRDLSSGNFAGAAAQYTVLQAAADYPKRDEAAAKLRLTGAMMGRLIGKPVTRPVVLPGGTFTPEQFEQMVTRLAADRKGHGVPGTARPAGPPPEGTTAKLTHLADLAPVTSIYRDTGGPPTSFATDEARIAISHGVRLYVSDSAAGKLLWSTPTPDKDSFSRWPKDGYLRAPARILRVGQTFVVRTPEMGELACFEAASGKAVWKRSYDHRILSDPVRVGSSLVVITARYGDDGALFVRRISPRTGESSVARRLMRLRDEWPPLGRPAVIGETMLLRSAGGLINCDLHGTIRWARRLPLLPAEALPEFHTHAARDDMIVLNDRHVIFTAPGSPRIACVEIATGLPVWSRMIPAPVRLVGLVAGRLAIAEPDRISVLDPRDGKTQWSRTFEAAGEWDVLPAGNDTLLLVRLKKPVSRKTPPIGRSLRWISARNGRFVKEIPIDGDLTVYETARLFGDAKRVFGLANFTGRSSSKGKVFMIEIAP